MDADLVLIFGFVLVIASLAFFTAHRIHRRVVEHEERKLELIARTEEAKEVRNTASSDAQRKLEERVRVLERIATDRSPELAAQIEQLRDLHEIDERTSKERAQ
jgi:hypothetical protein